MERTKLPLPKPSGLKPPQIRLKGNLETVPASVVRKPLVSEKQENMPPKKTHISHFASMGLRRRSKSVTDLRPLSEKPATESKINQKTLKYVNTNKAQPATSRTAIKRAAPDNTSQDAVKAKVSKQVKLPDWDYKGRFNQLTEKHIVVQESLKEAKRRLSDLADVESQFRTLQEKCEDIQKRNTALTSENISLKSENSTFKSLNSEQKLALAKLNTDHHEMQTNYNELLIKEQNNSEKIAQLLNELTDLKADHKEILKEHETLQEKFDLLVEGNKNLLFEFNSNKQQNTILSKQLEEVTKMNGELTEEVRLLKSDLRNSDVTRRQLHNTIQDLKGNIRVFCRVRPPINEEEKDRLQCSINFLDENSLEIRKGKESISAINGKPTELKVEFSFDKVFPPETTQEIVFEELAQLVQSALDGYHVCVFAYGQTGSGKTFTMQGQDRPSNLGMIPRSIDLIFNTIEHLRLSGWKYTVEASFLEIYNENIHDLLNINSKQNYDIRFNEGKGTTVTNLTTQPISSAEELRKLMLEAQKNRATAATDFNEHSSRSHAVTKIFLQGVNEENNTVYSGSINLVDLAGSESAKTSASDRLVETKNINKSLSTLGSVMLALYNKDSHIPYRNSKLTYLLQSCLGGNSKTLMFVNISPFEECYGESISSLRFASKVKEVKTALKRNKVQNIPGFTPIKS